MKLSIGHLNLFKIYEFVATHPHMCPDQNGGVKEYSNLIKELLNQVPKEPGWYLWGKFNDIGWWETIYLGKAGKQKTSSLNTRLYDELREESIAFWGFVFGKEIASKQFLKNYKGKYKNQISRSLRKTGTHFIVWISDSEIEEKDIAVQEKILIERYRPTYNAQRISYPKQTKNIHEIIKRIEAMLIMPNFM